MAHQAARLTVVSISPEARTSLAAYTKEEPDVTMRKAAEAVRVKGMKGKGMESLDYQGRGGKRSGPAPLGSGLRAGHQRGRGGGPLGRPVARVDSMSTAFPKSFSQVRRSS